MKNIRVVILLLILLFATESSSGTPPNLQWGMSAEELRQCGVPFDIYSLPLYPLSPEVTVGMGSGIHVSIEGKAVLENRLSMKANSYYFYNDALIMVTFAIAHYRQSADESDRTLFSAVEKGIEEQYGASKLSPNHKERTLLLEGNESFRYIGENSFIRHIPYFLTFGKRGAYSLLNGIIEKEKEYRYKRIGFPPPPVQF